MNNQNEMNPFNEILNISVNLLNDFNYEFNQDNYEFNEDNNIIQAYNVYDEYEIINENNVIVIENDDDDDQTIHEMEVTEEMKIEYCSSYVQHIYCFLKQSPGEINFDYVCETQYGNNIEDCAMNYLKNYILNIWNFNTWLFDFAYIFPDSTNFLNQFIQEISVEDLMVLINTSLPNEENL